ncbi:MAG: reverse transcriptase domain-containing protein, partial [Bacteroidota bacterium]
FKNQVCDKSIHVGGKQRILTHEGYAIPLTIHHGLPRLKMRPYTSTEWDSLPHIMMTDQSPWDPNILDHAHDDQYWFDAEQEIDPSPDLGPFNDQGNYLHRVNTTHVNPESVMDDADSIADDAPESAHNDGIRYFPRETQAKNYDFHKLRPLFGWLSADVIKHTFEKTTQFARIPMGTHLKRFFKSPNPALNVHRRNERLACDIIYSNNDVTAVDNGSSAAVIFYGCSSTVTDVYGIKSDKEFVNTLEDNIRDRGAPDKLISDRAQVEISKRVLSILRSLFIGSWQSEPHQQQQNPAERRIQTLKTTTNRIMDRTGAPPDTWLLCLLYVCFLLNHTYNSNIKDIPLTKLTGSTVDISPLLRFAFWDKVYYKMDDSDFPSKSKEGVGHIVGISEHVGHAMTWKILTTPTQKVLYRSQVRPFDSQDRNLRVELADGELPHTEYVKLRSDLIGKNYTSDDAVLEAELDPGETEEDDNTVDPEELIGRTFLTEEQEDGQKYRARIVKMVEDHESSVEENPTRIKFVCSMNDDKVQEILTYNKVMDFISKQNEDDTLWKFKRITAHQGPLRSNHPDYRGSAYNVLVEWENGESTYEPLSIIAADDPVTCAIYAKENDLLDTPGWIRFKPIAKRHKKYLRVVNQAKLRSFRSAPKYKYGFEVPRNYKHAMELDQKNGNTKWKDAIEKEMSCMVEYKVFMDKGHSKNTFPPSGYKQLRVHLIFDVKHDGRHRARLVADGHLTDVPTESVYSGVVSLRGFRLVAFLAELNKLEMWGTDISSAYLEAYTSEKLYVIAGPEFGDHEGHIMVVSRALYGLRTSGARWHERLADCLRELGFSSCRAEPDIWMRKKKDKYEYIAVYVDDLALVLHDPAEFISTMKNKYNFEFKGSGPISFHLGMDFNRDDDGTLRITPDKYIEKIMDNYKRTFGEAPRQNVMSPVEKGDHPELDESEFLDDEGISRYQSLIGSLQWAVSIGRFDIQTPVMTLSSFRAAPRRGHLDRAKRIFGYLAKMKHSAIRIRTEEPDYSDLPDVKYDWNYSVYGENLKEFLPVDAPEPLGPFVTLSHFVDANLMHDILSGKSVTGILHLINKMPIDWFSKKQATVETATYGSEFVAARTCVEQIIDLRTTLRYLGVNLRERSYMFGDNESVVNSSTMPHGKLHKRHMMLSFHRVRHAIASGFIKFSFIDGAINPADILSKHWAYQAIWPRLKALLFWKGNTMDMAE